MISRIAVVLITVLFLIPADTFAQPSATDVLTLEDAKRIADAAEERANQDNWTVVISIVDAGGHPILLRRIDGTQLGSIDIALEKAQTAVYYKRPTKAFQDGVSGGNYGIMALPNVLPFEGGVPITRNGEIIGGIGVSGVTAQQDGIIAEAGINAL
jgi:glc operon protein GlcG